MRIQPVIMSGGAGTRLWPLSRKARPKQFLALNSDQTLFKECALRVAPGAGQALFVDPIAIGAAIHVDLVKAEFASIGVAPRLIVGEPCPRNTAAVAAVAALLADPDLVVLLLPSDHRIEDAAGFRACVAVGAKAAAAGSIVTFGVAPVEPHVGFGYIERGDSITDDVFRIRKFHEKPTLEKAKSYVASGAYFWNAGIFLFTPAAMIAAFEAFAPDILDCARASIEGAHRVGARLDLDPEKFAECRSDSIDYAIMEKTANAAVVAPVSIGWSDVGAWSALDPDRYDPRVFAVDSDRSVIRTDGPFVGVIGLDDIVVVATGDAVLVVRKDRAQDVRLVVEALKARGRDDLL